MGPIYEAGDGFCFIVAKTGAGHFQVFASDPNYCGGAFYQMHGVPIRREAAEAMAADCAGHVRDSLPELHHDAADVRESASMNMAQATEPCNDRAELFNIAAGLTPLLDGTPEASALAWKIADAKPWLMRGRDVPDDSENPC